MKVAGFCRCKNVERTELLGAAKKPFDAVLYRCDIVDGVESCFVEQLGDDQCLPAKLPADIIFKFSNDEYAVEEDRQGDEDYQDDRIDDLRIFFKKKASVSGQLH